MATTMPVLTLQTTDIVASFPPYIDPFESVVTMTPPVGPGHASHPVSRVRDEPDRHPSPQPSHISVSAFSKHNGNGHRILRSATVGYVAPEFKGKSQQMREGLYLGPFPRNPQPLMFGSVQSRMPSVMPAGFRTVWLANRSPGSTTSWVSMTFTSS
jgi:hypothetical protein